MTGLVAKVLCGECDHLLCRVYDDAPRGLAYKLTAGKRGAWTTDPAVWCPGHGWADLTDMKLIPGKIVTHRAKMFPGPPVPQ